MQRQGIGAVPMYHPNTYNQTFVKEAGQLFEGDYVAVAFRPFEADAGKSTLDDFQKWMAKQRTPVTELAMYGWINADTAYQGLLAAGKDFDRQKVIAATDAMHAYTAGGLVNPIDFGRQHEPPTQADPKTHGYAKDCVSFVKVHDGRFTIVGDRAKPWFCWPGGTRAWSKPVATNFG
jgi:branched-chain amino acid transport system substrate-binding protein